MYSEVDITLLLIQSINLIKRDKKKEKWNISLPNALPTIVYDQRQGILYQDEDISMKKYVNRISLG